MVSHYTKELREALLSLRQTFREIDTKDRQKTKRDDGKQLKWVGIERKRPFPFCVSSDPIPEKLSRTSKWKVDDKICAFRGQLIGWGFNMDVSQIPMVLQDQNGKSYLEGAFVKPFRIKLIHKSKYCRICWKIAQLVLREKEKKCYRRNYIVCYNNNSSI